MLYKDLTQPEVRAVSPILWKVGIAQDFLYEWFMDELPYNEYDADVDYILEHIDGDLDYLRLDSSFDLYKVFKPINFPMYNPYTGDEDCKLYIGGEGWEADNCCLQWDIGTTVYLIDVTEDSLEEEGYEYSDIYHLYNILYEIQKYLNAFKTLLSDLRYAAYNLDNNKPSWCAYLDEYGFTFERTGDKIEVFENGAFLGSAVA